MSTTEFIPSKVLELAIWHESIGNPLMEVVSRSVPTELLTPVLGVSS